MVGRQLGFTHHGAELVIFADAAHAGGRKCRAIERISHNNPIDQY